MINRKNYEYYYGGRHIYKPINLYLRFIYELITLNSFLKFLAFYG